MSKFRKETNSLLKSLQNGDKSKWEELYLYTFEHIKGMAIKYLVDKTEWMDVVSQTYLQIFQHIQHFDNTQDGYNWMCKTVHNISIDFNKSKLPTVNIDELSESIFVCIDELFDSKYELYRELRLLTAEEQYLIWLRFWEELSYSEIAKLTGSKKSTVHIRINKILKIIDKKMKK